MLTFSFYPLILPYISTAVYKVQKNKALYSCEMLCCCVSMRVIVFKSCTANFIIKN